MCFFIPDDVAIDDLRKLYLIHVSTVISALEDSPTTSKAVILFMPKKAAIILPDLPKGSLTFKSLTLTRGVYNIYGVHSMLQSQSSSSFRQIVIPSPIGTMLIVTRLSSKSFLLKSLILIVFGSFTNGSATLPYHRTLSITIKPPTLTSLSRSSKYSSYILLSASTNAKS